MDSDARYPPSSSETSSGTPGDLTLPASPDALTTENDDAPGDISTDEALPPHLLRLVAHGWELGALGGHALRVAALSYATARHYGLHPRVCERLRYAAAFHDIGKLLIPTEVLTKPGPLTPEERQLIQNHTVYGYQLLLRSDEPTLREAAVIAYCHHERVDGRGYPRRRVGSEIPLFARIVSVVDVFDALTSDRTYRPALAEPRVLELLHERVDRHFDPEVVAAFLALLERQPDLPRRLRWLTARQADPLEAALEHTHADTAMTAKDPQASLDWVDAWLDAPEF